MSAVGLIKTYMPAILHRHYGASIVLLLLNGRAHQSLGTNADVRLAVNGSDARSLKSSFYETKLVAVILFFDKYLRTEARPPSWALNK